MYMYDFFFTYTMISQSTGDTYLQCTVNLINDGITVEGSSVTIQFRGSPVDSYHCSLDDEEPFPCT